jgi:hypothetical protein
MVGTTMGFQVKIMEALAPQTSPSNPVEVPTVACEHLFCLPLRGHFFTRSNRRHGGYCRDKLAQYHEKLIMAYGYEYGRLPPVANGWGTTQPVPYKCPTTPG